jgi:cardiolipin synthase (CMP-forming)
MDRWLRQLPNVITSIRILLIVPIAMALSGHRPVETLWLFCVAGASDGIDGFLAKRFGWQTDLGGLLDPVADKLLLATVFVMLALLGSVPLWLTVAVIARDCIIVLGAVAYRIALGPVVARPSRVSKLTTLCQVIFILVVIGTPQFSWPPAWQTFLGALVFVTVAVSGLDYVLVYSRMAAEHGRSRDRVVRTGGSKPA